MELEWFVFTMLRLYRTLEYDCKARDCFSKLLIFFSLPLLPPKYLEVSKWS